MQRFVILPALVSGVVLMATERPSYTVERRAAGLEIRQYRPYVVAQTDVEAPMERAGNEAFRRLGGYIFGANGTGQKIAMTAPVAMSPLPEFTGEVGQLGLPTSRGAKGGHREQGEQAVPPLMTKVSARGGGYRVTFMMPSSFTLASLPPPKDPRVTFAEVPARRMAALAYGGNWSEARYQAHLEKLRAALAAEGLKAVGAPVWARYNSPMMPSFMRTNEILVEVSP